MDNKIFVVATVTARDGKQEELGQALLTLVPIARTEPGFIQYDLHQSVDRPNEFLFYEIWHDQHSLDLHNNTESMKAFGVRTGHLVESVRVEKYKLISPNAIATAVVTGARPQAEH